MPLSSPMRRAGLVAALGLLGLVGWFVFAPTDAPRAVGPPPIVPTQATLTAAPEAGRLPLPRPANHRARTVVNVGTPGAATPAPAPAEVTPPPAAPAPKVRAPVGPEAVKASIEEVVGEDLMGPILSCLQASGPVDGSMNLELVLDPTGLREAAIVDRDPLVAPLPPAFLDCTAEAVWNAGWAPTRDGDLTVRYPIRVSVE